jgi:3-oxoacyl-[acyl-carrier-protein] synthase III
LRNVRIVGTGAHLPGPPISNQALAEVAGSLPDEVLEGLQVRSRHWIADLATGAHLESNSEMAAAAAANALAVAGLEAGEVDLLVVSTSSPEYHLPPMATQVQDRLGIERCAVLDIRSGCAGSVAALDVARLQLERGSHRTAVVIGSEVVSPLLVPIFQGRDPDSIRMRDRIPIYAFGDGAGAIVLQASESDEPGFIGSASACVGGGRKPGMSVVGGGTHAPISVQLAAPRLVELKLDVVESARYTPHVLSAALTDVLAACAMTAEQVDVCVVPEGNAGYLLEEMEQEGLLVEDWKALRGRIVENLADVGATGSAAVPLALDQAWRAGGVLPGQVVMLLALETSKWIYAATVLRWTAPTPALVGATGVG